MRHMKKNLEHSRSGNVGVEACIAVSRWEQNVRETSASLHLALSHLCPPEIVPVSRSGAAAERHSSAASIFPDPPRIAPKATFPAKSAALYPSWSHISAWACICTEKKDVSEPNRWFSGGTTEGLFFASCAQARRSAARGVGRGGEAINGAERGASAGIPVTTIGRRGPCLARRCVPFLCVCGPRAGRLLCTRRNTSGDTQVGWCCLILIIPSIIKKCRNISVVYRAWSPLFSRIRTYRCSVACHCVRRAFSPLNSDANNKVAPGQFRAPSRGRCRQPDSPTAR